MPRSGRTAWQQSQGRGYEGNFKLKLTAENEREIIYSFLSLVSFNFAQSCSLQQCWEFIEAKLLRPFPYIHPSGLLKEAKRILLSIGGQFAILH